MIRDWLLPRLIYFAYMLWSATWRVRVDETPEVAEIVKSGRPLIFAHWHRDELAIVQFVRRYRIATMTSTSKDGQLIDYVIRRMGGATTKGSSTRGGSVALKGLVKLMGENYRASMAVDGPRGPIYQPKPGVFELAKLTSGSIAPVGVASSRVFIFQKSWNKARLPLPFARITISFGRVLTVDEDNARNPEYAKQLANEINGACQLSEQKLLLNSRNPLPLTQREEKTQGPL